MGKKILISLAFFLCFSSVIYAKDSISWVFTNYPPANYKTESGEYKGFLHDITIEAFEKRMGMKVDISIFPWKRCQFLVESGKYDMMLTIPTPVRKGYAVATDEPVWRKKRIIYTYAGHPKLQQIKKMKGLQAIRDANLTVLSYSGNGWVESAVKGANIPIIFGTSVEGMYKMLAKKRADIIIEEPSIANPSIEKLGLNSAIIATDGVGAESTFNLLISKKSKHVGVVKELNKTLNGMWKDGTIDRILKQYGM